MTINNSETYDAVLSDWGRCVLSDGRFFIAGKVSGDRRQRFRDGTHITTSLVQSPPETVVDGNIVQTLNGRYLLVQRYAVDDASFAKLDAWIAAQPEPPTLRDVLAADDRELAAAYILRGFRLATAEAVWQRDGNDQA